MNNKDKPSSHGEKLEKERLELLELIEKSIEPTLKQSIKLTNLEIEFESRPKYEIIKSNEGSINAEF